MKNRKWFVAVLLVLIATSNLVAEEAPEALKTFVDDVLVEYSNDSSILSAVLAENAKGKSLSQIEQADNEWKNTAGISDFMTQILESDIADYLRELQDRYEFFAEVFVMDNLGANVAMTDKTSDYWQGDESKFKNSFDGGTGSVFIDEVEFDESAQCYMVQVSIPVMNGANAVGAITFGIDLDAFEETM